MVNGHSCWRNVFASPVWKAQWTRASRKWLVAQCLYKPNAPVAPLVFAPTPCNRSPTFLFASKNLATHRSTQTLSPLLRSPSVYRVLIHLAWHVLKSRYKDKGYEARAGQNTCETIRLKMSVTMSSLSSRIRGGRRHTRKGRRTLVWPFPYVLG